MDYEAKAMQWKQDAVTEVTELIQQGGTLGIVDVAGVPAALFKGMRAQLRGDLSLRVMKKTLMKLAWERAGHDVTVLESLFEGADTPALVQSSNVDSFALFQQLQKTRTGRAPKGGDIAPFDIIIEAQDTGFPPGPIVGELSAVGIPAKIQKGSVQILKKATPVKEGEVISGELALMLDKLGVHPVEIGLILKGTYEDGTQFDLDVLNIDFDEFMGNVTGAIAGTFNLACHLGWFTPETAPALLSKAIGEALAVAVEAAIPTDDTTSILVGKAHSQMMAVAGQLDSSAQGEALASVLGAAAAAVASTAPAAADEPEAEAAEEEEEEEEEAEFGGLGDLFG